MDVISIISDLKKIGKFFNFKTADNKPTAIY